MDSSSKTRTARNVLTSWLKAAGVKTGIVEGADVGVWTPNGLKGIKVGSGNDPQMVYVSPEDIVNSSNRHSVTAFEVLMDDLGVALSKKFYRGDFNKLDSRTYCARTLEDGTSELDLTMFRHLEFRTAPNIDAAEMEKYRSCIEIACRKFWKMNSARLERLCIDAEDLQQYARVWTVNFLHKYRRENSHSATCGLLVNYLKQRFTEYYRLLVRHEASIQPTMAVAMTHVYSDHSLGFGDFAENDDVQFSWGVSPDVEKAEEIERMFEDKSKEPSYQMRAKHAKSRLRKAIANTSREELLERLTEAANNEHLAADTQELAQRILAELSEGAVEEQA